MHKSNVGGRARPALLLAVAGCTSLVAAPSRAADRHWSPAAPDNASFQDPTQWVEGQVPGANDRAVFSPPPTGAGQTVRLDASLSTDQLLLPAGKLTLDLASSSVSYTLNSSSATSIVVGTAAGDAARLSVQGSTVFGKAAVVGDAAQSSGTVSLTGSGRLIASSLVLGASATASGTLSAGFADFGAGFDTLNMPGAMTIGKAGAGTFENLGTFVQTNYLEGDTVLGDAATGSGAVRVGENATEGAARWTAPGAFVVGNAGAGDVVIRATGTLLSGNHKGVAPSDAYRGDADHPLYVAKLAGSTGTVTVAGLWVHYGAVAIGGTETTDGGAGTLTLAPGGSFGNANRPLVIRRGGALVIDGGTLAVGSIDNSHGGTFDFRSGSLLFEQTNLVVGGAGSLLGPDLTADTLAARTLRVVAGAHLTITGGIQTDALTVEGALVNNGSITADAVRITAGATFSGTGGVYGLTGDNAAIVVEGTLAPGNSIGRIDARGRVTFAAGSVYTAEIGPAALDNPDVTADLLAVEGDLDLSAANDRLDLVTLPGAPGGRHLIATYTGTLLGAFDHVPSNYVIDYGEPGAIYASPVPEPTAVALAAGAAGALLLRRRRGRA